MPSRAESIRANDILRDKFEALGISWCEIDLPGCQRTWGLSFAHRRKRRHYKSVEELSDINEVVMACLRCHMMIEQSKKLTEETFKRLRP